MVEYPCWRTWYEKEIMMPRSNTPRKKVRVAVVVREIKDVQKRKWIIDQVVRVYTSLPQAIRFCQDKEGLIVDERYRAILREIREK